MINATAYLCASKLPGSVTFQLQLSPDSTLGQAAQEVPPDLSSVPKDYHKFADVFSKGKADKLPPHCSYNLKIELEEGTPPPNHMYSLSVRATPKSNSVDNVRALQGDATVLEDMIKL